MTSYDIIVVGAGYAGTAAAKKCGEAGMKTLLLERAGRVGEKVQSTAAVQRGFLDHMPSWVMGDGSPIERELYGATQNFLVGDEIVYSSTVKAIVPICYGFYSFRFTNWAAQQAVGAGVELRESTTVVDVIKEGETVVGVVTDKGEKLGTRVVIDAEGSECLLAIKAGLRNKVPPEAVELILSYVFDMTPEKIEEVIGNTMECFWAAPGDKLCHPPGEGTPGIFILPMRDTIHVCVGQILAMRDREALRQGGSREVQETYFSNLFKTRRWREGFAPHVKLRAKKFATVPIYGNLMAKGQPCYANGMLMVGDAGGFMTTLGHGVGTALMSGDIAADVAIEALNKNDISASFLKAFDDRCKAHPVLGWTLDSTLRFELNEIPRELPWIIYGVQRYFTTMSRPDQGVLSEPKKR